MNSWFLSTLSPWPLLLGLVVIIAAVGLLYRAWRRSQRDWPMVSLGWVALLLVHWPLGLALGFDRGWAVAAILPGFIALLWIAMTTPWQHWNHHARQKSGRGSTPSVTNKVALRTRANQTGQVLMQVLVVGILSFATAVSIALVLFSLLDTSVANRTVYSALLVMVLWPILMVWSKAKKSLVKPAIYFGGVTVGALLFTPVFF
ncbi:MAG TPA: hypothetical protein VL995_03285 [Cellvibrio sp.]|nr:hypothetical protein [Cellvibrio sp.]